jgi:ATP-dependent helicase/DNAse subunit B
MPITLITGPANAGKAELVMDAVRAHAARDAQPLLIVPTRADVDHYRRELAGERAVMGVEVARFRELIGAIVRCAGEHTPVVGPIARERMLAAIAARQAPRAGWPAASPGFIAALARLVAELQVHRATPARLRRGLEAATGAGSAAASLADLYEAYLLALRRSGRADEEQLAVRALDAVRREPSLWGVRPVLFYGFDDLTRLQQDAIHTLGHAAGADVTVSLAFEPGRVAFAGRASTFNELAPLASCHHQLAARAQHYAPRSRAALSHLERSLFEEDARRRSPHEAVRLLEGADERSELQAVAQHISALLRGGMPAGEIAVVARTTAAGSQLLEEVFAAAGIPFAMPRRRRFADSSLGAALVGLLRCVSRPSGAAGARRAGAGGEIAHEDGGGEQPTSAGSAGDLLAFLRAPGVLSRPELADGLERALRRAGANDARRAQALWEQRHWPLRSLEELRLAQQRGPATVLARVERELIWLFSAARRDQASVLAPHEQLEAAALSAGRRALGELRELARAAPELAPQDAFALAQVLAGLELLAGEQPSPNTVAVLDPLALRARRVRALFVCRLQEGAFPSWGSEPALLGEEERRRLAEACGLLLGAQQETLAAERYLLYAAVSRPQELLVLSWHAATEDGAAAARSLFVDDVCDLFDESLSERRALGASNGHAAHAQVARLHAATGRPRGELGVLRDRELLAELAAHTWSPSSLGVWLCCPVRWLVERLLRADDLDPDPEPLARGALAHVVLAQTLEGLRGRTGSARLTRAGLPGARELLAEALRENEQRLSLSPSPQRAAAARRRLHADLLRYLEHAVMQAEGERADATLAPRHLELEFGFAGSARDGEAAPSATAPGDAKPLPALDIGGGVMVRGRIDRVDANDAGEAVVYDYKGANVAPPARWVAQGDLQVALYMHAVEELLGLRAVGGFYQPLSGSDLRARGVLEADAAVQLQCVGDDARDSSRAQELREEVLAAAREAAAQAARGELRARPATCAFKGGCSYPSICRCEA